MPHILHALHAVVLFNLKYTHILQVLLMLRDRLMLDSADGCLLLYVILKRTLTLQSAFVLFILW
jgi:hypothetical protein